MPSWMTHAPHSEVISGFTHTLTVFTGDVWACCTADVLLLSEDANVVYEMYCFGNVRVGVAVVIVSGNCV